LSLSVTFSDSAVIAQRDVKCAGHLKGEDERPWCLIALYGVCRQNWEKNEDWE